MITCCGILSRGQQSRNYQLCNFIRSRFSCAVIPRLQPAPIANCLRSGLVRRRMRPGAERRTAPRKWRCIPTDPKHARDPNASRTGTPDLVKVPYLLIVVNGSTVLDACGEGATKTCAQSVLMDTYDR